MASTSETGHAKNASNFEDLISHTVSHGTKYQPSNPDIAIPALKTLQTNADKAITAVNDAVTADSKVTNVRETLFTPFKPLITRIIGSLNATKALPATKEDAKSLGEKLRGYASSTQKAKVKELLAAGKEDNTISTAQQSYDSLVNNFDKLISLLKAEPLYVPNEVELKVASLTSLYTQLKANNKATGESEIVLNNARKNRTKVLYAPETGLIDIAASVKEYTKSVFGAASSEYKTISKVAFKAIK